MTTSETALSARTAFWIGALLWGVAVALLLIARHDSVTDLAFRDPDDALRLVQVRDWLAGQSWFDVHQYRIHPPFGVPMHWSRLVDLPIAAMLAMLDPLLGPWLAERITLVAVPLLLLALLFGLVYALALRITGRRGEALFALALLALSIPLVLQFAPLRIDHHGWQILLGTLATLGLLDERRPVRGALVTALACASWMQISIEGLPFTVVAGALLGARFWQGDTHWPAFRAYLLGLGLGLPALQLALRGPAGLTERLCDAVALPYLAPFVVIMGGALIGARLLGTAQPWRRLGVLLVAGAAGIAAFGLLGRDCLAGPFAHLDPLVRQLWYEAVLEGLPIERQSPQAILLFLPCLIGMACTIAAARHSRDLAERTRWLILLFMLAGAFFIATRVFRAVYLAEVLALPGGAWLLATATRWVRTLRLAPARIALMPGLLLLTPMGSVAPGVALLPLPPPPQTDIRRCMTLSGTRGLAALPPATLFTPLDIGSHVLAYTPHSVVATGHHRNMAAMRLVIRAFEAEPAVARRLIATTPARYVVFCKYGNEAADFYRYAPQGLAARLAAWRAPDWLEPVPMPPGETLLVYRIRRDGNGAPHR